MGGRVRQKRRADGRGEPLHGAGGGFWAARSVLREVLELVEYAYF